MWVLSVLTVLSFPLIKLAKKLKEKRKICPSLNTKRSFPLIKLAKKLKDHNEMMVEELLKRFH